MWAKTIRKEAIAELSMGTDVDQLSERLGVPRSTLLSWNRRAIKPLKRRRRGSVAQAVVTGSDTRTHNKAMLKAALGVIASFVDSLDD